MSILIKGIPLGGYEISIMKDGERYRARVDGIWCEVEEIPITDSDTISRQQAIAEVEKARAYVGHRYNIESMVGRDIFEILDSVGLGISELPPANCSETPNSSDTISRQAAIETVMECYDNDELFEVYEDKLRELPPAQPERNKGHWIKISPANIYECSECGKHVMTNDICAYDFCHGCGADMRGVTE